MELRILWKATCQMHQSEHKSTLWWTKCTVYKCILIICNTEDSLYKSTYCKYILLLPLVMFI